MALLKRLYKTETARTHEAYLEYVKQQAAKNKKPMPFRRWLGKGPPVVHKVPKPLYKSREVATVKEIRERRERARALSRRSRRK